MTKEEATKILKDFHDKSALFSVRTALETLYPELAGSEDEQIRKELTKHLKEGVEGYMPAGDSSDYRRWLDWLEKQGKSSDQIHYWTEEEIEPIISDYLRGAEHYGGMIGRLRCLKPKSLEKQGEQKPVIEMKSAEESLGIDSDTYNKIVDECIYGEQKPAAKMPVSDELHELIRNTCACIDDAISCCSIKDIQDYLAQARTDANIALDMVKQKPADKVEPKFKVKYAGSEYNVLEIKEIAGDTYYGIEDEPNHIDYVLPDNCEIVSEQKSDWSEEDDDDAWMNDIISKVENNLQLNKAEIDWLKSLKTKTQPKQGQSEEDDVMIYKLLAVVELYYDRDGDDLDKQSCIDWLKALKQRIGG